MQRVVLARGMLSIHHGLFCKTLHLCFWVLFLPVHHNCSTLSQQCTLVYVLPIAGRSLPVNHDQVGHHISYFPKYDWHIFVVYCLRSGTPYGPGISHSQGVTSCPRSLTFTRRDIESKHTSTFSQMISLLCH